jgi:multidrug efflux pump subunit AcrB
MTDQSIFTEQVSDPNKTIPQTNDLFADQLAAIKNGSGQQKYATTEEALKALAHAQGYIPELKTEIQAQGEIIAKLKEELDKKASLEQLMERIAQPQATQNTVGTPPQANVLDPQEVINLVNQTLASQNQAASQKANKDKVEQTLVSKFGDKTIEVIQAKAKELGLTPQKIGELASISPQAALALFNESTSSTLGVTTGSVTIPGFKQSEHKPLEKPAKSLLAGASSKEQAAYMAQIREEVYRKHNIEI